MFRIAACWVKNPVCSWNELAYADLYCKAFNSLESAINEVCKQHGFSFSSVSELMLIKEKSYCDCANYFFKVKENYQLEHKEVNQAAHFVRLTLLYDAE